jgi:hypothetical protein
MRIAAIVIGIGWEKAHRKTGNVFIRPKNMNYT